jgi:hypothetical protein
MERATLTARKVRTICRDAIQDGSHAVRCDQLMDEFLRQTQTEQSQ